LTSLAGIEIARKRGISYTYQRALAVVADCTARCGPSHTMPAGHEGC
jgi:hypothetical protein